MQELGCQNINNKIYKMAIKDWTHYYEIVVTEDYYKYKRPVWSKAKNKLWIDRERHGTTANWVVYLNSSKIAVFSKKMYNALKFVKQYIKTH